MLVIFGGSFNPPTKAHLELYNKIKKMFDCKILLMPTSKNNYTWKDNLISNEHRLNMLKLMFDSNDISLYEFNLNEYKGTYQMLKDHLKLDKDIYFMCGADNLKQMSLWLNYENLIKEFKFIILKRPTDNIMYENMLDYKDNFTIVDMNINISSSSVRNNLDKYRNYLTDEVYKYIKDNNLYGVDKNV